LIFTDRYSTQRKTKIIVNKQKKHLINIRVKS